MTEKQVTSATAVKESLAAIPAQWLKTKEAITAGDQDAFMASMQIPEKWQEIEQEIDMCVSVLAVSIETKKGDYKDISKTASDLKKQSKEFVKNVDEMVESDKKFA